MDRRQLNTNAHKIKVKTAQNVKKIKEFIAENKGKTSIRKLSKLFKLKQTSVFNIVTKVLKMRKWKLVKYCAVSEKNKKVFSDEKHFEIIHKFNCKNDGVWGKKGESSPLEFLAIPKKQVNEIVTK